MPGNAAFAQEDTGAPRPVRRVQLYPERATDLSPHEKEYLQNQSQKHEKARREARAHLDALRVELAWLADPLLFAQPPSIKAVGKDDKFVVELRGVVSSNLHRQRALDLAEKFAETPVRDKLLVLVGPSPRRASVPIQELQAKAERHLADKLIEFSQDLHIDEVYPDGVVKVSGRVLSYEDKVSVSRSLRRLTGCTAVENRCEVGPMMQDGELVTIITSDGHLSLPGRIQEKTMGPVAVAPEEKPALRERPVFVPVKAIEPPVAAREIPEEPAPKVVPVVVPRETSDKQTLAPATSGPVVEPQVIEVAPPSAFRNPKPIINTPLTPPAQTKPVTDRVSSVAISQSGRVVRPAKGAAEVARLEKSREEIPLGSVERIYQGKPYQISGSVRFLPREEVQKRLSAEYANASANPGANFGNGERKAMTPLPRPETTRVVAQAKPESASSGSKTETAPRPKTVSTVPVQATVPARESQSAVIPASAGTTGTIEIEPPVSPSLPLPALVDLAKKACGSYAQDVTGTSENGISRITIKVRDYRSEAEVLRRVLALASFGHSSVRVEVERMR